MDALGPGFPAVFVDSRWLDETAHFGLLSAFKLKNTRLILIDTLDPDRPESHADYLSDERPDVYELFDTVVKNSGSRISTVFTAQAADAILSLSNLRPVLALSTREDFTAAIQPYVLLVLE